MKWRLRWCITCHFLGFTFCLFCSFIVEQCFVRSWKGYCHFLWVHHVLCIDVFPLLRRAVNNVLHLFQSLHMQGRRSRNILLTNYIDPLSAIYPYFILHKLLILLSNHIYQLKLPIKFTIMIQLIYYLPINHVKCTP